jgi:uncharacterized membrane protein
LRPFIARQRVAPPVDPIRVAFRRVRVPVALGTLVFLVAAAVTPRMWKRPQGDVQLYANYAIKAVHGLLPYRDFSLEYPPGFFVPALPPAVLTRSTVTYQTLFVGEMLISALAMLVAVALTMSLLRRSLLDIAIAMALIATLPFTLGSLTLQRYDLAPATLTSVALLALVVRRTAVSGGLLGVAAAMKLYPALLLPGLVSLVVRRIGLGAAVRCTIAAAAAIASLVLPFLVLAPAGLKSMIDYQRLRPLQMESLGATLGMLEHRWQSLDIHLEASFASVGLYGPGAGHIDTLMKVSLAVVVAYLVLLSLKAPDTVALATTWCAIVVATVALGRVLSPQYLLWIVPLVPFVPGRAGRLAVAVTASALVTTRIWLEYGYADVARRIESDSLYLLTLRNALLLALLGILVFAATEAVTKPATMGRWARSSRRAARGATR